MNVFGSETFFLQVLDYTMMPKSVPVTMEVFFNSHMYVYLEEDH